MAEKETEFATKLLSISLRRRLIFDGLENRIVKESLKILLNLEEEITAKLRANLLEPNEATFAIRRNRLNKALEDVKANINAASFRLGRKWIREMSKVADVTTEFAGQEIEKAMPFGWTSKLMSPTQLKAIIDSKPFEGELLKDWAKAQGRTNFARVKRAANISLVNGEGTAKAIGRVRNQIKIGRANAEAVVRTAFNHVHNTARTETFKANKEIIKGEIYWTALDTRVSDICRPRHGKKFLWGDEEKYMLPAHWNCRSTYIPWVKTWAEMQMDLPEVESPTATAVLQVPKSHWPKTRIQGWLRKHGVSFDEEESKKSLLEISNAEVEEYRDILRQTVPRDVGYYDWLGQQPEKFIRGVFGPERFALWKSGKIPLSSFDKRGGGLKTFDELQEEFPNLISD